MQEEDKQLAESVPNRSESFGGVPHAAEVFGTLRHSSERNESHTLTVREVARMFEAAGVARTERSVVNWCQLNSQGLARLDAYFDPNERRYYITLQSAELAIAEEKAKAGRNTPLPPAETVPHDAAGLAGHQEANSEAGSERAKTLEKELMDLRILNSGKDFVIQHLREERQSFFAQLLDASRKVGELETKLLQIQPSEEGSPEAAVRADLAAP